MNVIFWALVILATVLAWLLLSFAFKMIGGALMWLVNRANDAIREEKIDESKGTKHINEKR